MAATFAILLNTSKTMAVHQTDSRLLREPLFQAEARQIDTALKQLSPVELRRKMHISASLADATFERIQSWGLPDTPYGLALDTFVGDIYRGLQASTFSSDDRHYADQVLGILSGLYGFVRPLDAIQPYRLEMGYSIAPDGYKNLYDFWGDRIAERLKHTTRIINVASEEYFKVVRPFVAENRVITPQFLTRKTPHDDSTFVAIHAKVARGAFAQWLVRTRQQEDIRYEHFTAYGYTYDATVSTPNQPTFIRVGDMKTM